MAQKKRQLCLGHKRAPCSSGLLSLSLHDGVHLEEEGDREQERRERQDKGRRGKREKKEEGGERVQG